MVATQQDAEGDAEAAAYRAEHGNMYDAVMPALDSAVAPVTLAPGDGAGDDVAALAATIDGVEEDDIGDSTCTDARRRLALGNATGRRRLDGSASVAFDITIEPSAVGDDGFSPDDAVAAIHSSLSTVDVHVSVPRSTSRPSSLTTAGKHCELASLSARSTLPSTEPL